MRVVGVGISVSFVIPCAAQCEAVRCRHGIWKGHIVDDPGSTQYHFVLQRIRGDDGRSSTQIPAFAGMSGWGGKFFPPASPRLDRGALYG